jgi:hypothetical protein
MESRDTGHFHCDRCGRVIHVGDKMVSVFVSIDEVMNDSDNPNTYMSEIVGQVSSLCLFCAASLLTKAVIGSGKFMAIEPDVYDRNN